MPPRPNRTLFPSRSRFEVARLAWALRQETAGGVIVLGAAVVALVWANSPMAHAYFALRDVQLGPEALHLRLSLGAWAADGLLAIFFFVVGLELKEEFVTGDLRSPRKAALPILAAVGGMVAPALLYVAINAGASDGALRGWAIPTATDIAFALAVLAIVNSHLPVALRTFLLTLAVVDDLLAVIIIGAFYTETVHPLPLLAALGVLVLFRVATRRGGLASWTLIPLALVTWMLVHASGVHATIAGVALGLVVPVEAARLDLNTAARLEHRIRPLSAGIAVPVFAFFAAGLSLGGMDGLRSSLTDRVALGVVVGLVAGKTMGIFGTTYLASRVLRLELGEGVRWLDKLGIAVVAGVGFTVSLLIGDLAFDASSTHAEHAKVAVLTGSTLSAV
ncbi:MAG: Na+/H+ antiporter NhaA, partial [Dehalococcoidia bacterium]